MQEREACCTGYSGGRQHVCRQVIENIIFTHEKAVKQELNIEATASHVLQASVCRRTWDGVTYACTHASSACCEHLQRRSLSLSHSITEEQHLLHLCLQEVCKQRAKQTRNIANAHEAGRQSVGVPWEEVMTSIARQEMGRLSLSLAAAPLASPAAHAAAAAAATTGHVATDAADRRLCLDSCPPCLCSSRFSPDLLLCL